MKACVSISYVLRAILDKFAQENRSKGERRPTPLPSQYRQTYEFYPVPLFTSPFCLLLTAYGLVKIERFRSQPQPIRIRTISFLQTADRKIFAQFYS
jgi:hypothetical protein